MKSLETVSSQSERQRKILELLVSHNQVYVNELSDFFNVTPETIRRDLSRLEAQHLLKKVHGGAVKVTFNTGFDVQLKFEKDFNERIKVAMLEKQAIAKRAVQLIQPGDTVFVDFGSTTLEFARHLSQIDDLTVICNAPLIAEIMQVNRTVEVILLGGHFIAAKLECLGSVTLNNVAQFFADYAIVGAGALHKTRGFMDQDVDEAALAKKMIEHSHKSIVLADGSKIGHYATALVAPWSQVDFLVTCPRADTWQDALLENYTQVIIAR